MKLKRIYPNKDGSFSLPKDMANALKQICSPNKKVELFDATKAENISITDKKPTSNYTIDTTEKQIRNKNKISKK